MHLHVIGTQRNKLNIKAMIGFYVWDSDSGELTYMTPAKIREILCTKQGEFSNIELSEYTEYGKIQGSHYNLDKLTYIQSEKEYRLLDEFTILESFSDNTYLLVKFDGKNVESCISSGDEVIAMQDKIWNYSSNGFGLYKRSSIKSNKLSSDIDRGTISKNNEDTVSSIKNRRDELMQQAYDKNIIWTIDTFKEFMQLNNWRYELIKTNDPPVSSKYIPKDHGYSYLYKLNNVDKNCSILHIPVGVVESDCLFSEAPCDLNTLIFSPGFRGIRALYNIRVGNKIYSNGDVACAKSDITHKDSTWVNVDFNGIESEVFDKMKELPVDLVSIHNIYMQDTPNDAEYWMQEKEDVILNGLSLINITGECVLQCKGKQLRDAFNMSSLKEIPKIDCKHIRYSFNNVISNNKILNLDIIVYYLSFINVQGDGPVQLVLGPNTDTITCSFRNMSISNVDVSQAQSLREISNSFLGVSTLETFDLSSLNNRFYKFGPGNLCKCPNLKNIILPDKIHNVMAGNAVDSPLIDEVIIPEEVNGLYGESFINGHCRVIYPRHMTEMSQNYCSRYTSATRFTPVFPESVTAVTGVLSNANCSFGDLGLPETIETISYKCFEGSLLKDFDSGFLPKLSIIPNRAFFNSRISYAVFRDNITKIGEDALGNCNQLSMVIFGANIQEMPANPFKACKPEGLIKVYLVKGSYAQKRLRKSNKLIIIEVDNTEEACKIELEGTTSKLKQSKYDMMLDGTEFDSLLDDYCRGNISYLYPLYKSLNDDESYMQEQLVLDTSKYGRIPLDSITTIHRVITREKASIQRLYDGVLEDEDTGESKNDDTSEDKLLRRFISLSNLITTISDNCERCFSESFVKNVEDNCLVDSLNEIIYVSRDAFIGLFALRFGDSRTVILLMEYMGNIVYITPFWSKPYAKMLRSESQMSLFSNKMHKYLNIGLGPMLLPGDKLDLSYASIPDTMIHGYRTPYDLARKILDNLRDTCIVIGISDFEKKSKRKHQDTVIYNMLILEELNGKLIECTGNIEFADKDNTDISRVNLNSIRNICDILDISSVNSQYTDMLINGFNDKVLRNILLKFTITKQEEENSRSNMDNYDLDGDMNLIYTAELIYQNNITTVEELMQNRQLLKRVLNSHLYDKANISMNYIKKYENIYKRSIMKPLGVHGEILLEFSARTSDYQQIYIIGIADSTTTMSSKKFLLGGMTSLHKSIILLYTLGHNRSEGITQEVGISNNRIDIDKFCVIMTKALPNFNSHGIKIHVAVDMCNGDSYIIGDVWDTDFYKLFRTKTYTQAVQLFNLFMGDKGDSLRNYLYSLVRHVNGDHRYSGQNCLEDIRSAILGGLPNNIPYTGSYSSIADILAKQPAKDY